MSAAAPTLAPDLVAGLRRLKLAAMRELAPQLRQTAKTQHWAPEELLRTLVEAEITARDASKRPDPAQGRSVPRGQDPRRVRPGRVHHQPRHPRLPRLAGVDHRPGEPLPGRADRDREESPGRADRDREESPARARRRRRPSGAPVRYFTAAELVENLYRGPANNSVGRIIVTLLRNDLIICNEVGFTSLDDAGAQLLFQFVAAAYERRALGIASHWPFESRGRFLPAHTTAVSLLDRILHHAHIVVTDGDS